MHTHCNEDPIDGFISHSAKELIDYAAKLNFNVLSITCHNKVVYSKGLQDYANQRNILLVPGAEKDIEGRHVLLYNFTQNEIDLIENFEDLRKIKKEHHFVIAPHPFYFHPKKISLFSKLENNIDLFDGIEFCHLYTRRLNSGNKKAKNIALKYNLPLVAGSDLHNLKHMDTNFSLVNSKKNISSLFKAIKNNNIEVSSRPRNTFELTKIFAFFATSPLKHKIFNSLKTN